jgi:hypothetical protein
LAVSPVARPLSVVTWKYLSWIPIDGRCNLLGAITRACFTPDSCSTDQIHWKVTVIILNQSESLTPKPFDISTSNPVCSPKFGACWEYWKIAVVNDDDFRFPRHPNLRRGLCQSLIHNWPPWSNCCKRSRWNQLG